MQAAMNIFTQQKRFDYGGLFTFPPGEKDATIQRVFGCLMIYVAATTIAQLN